MVVSVMLEFFPPLSPSLFISSFMSLPRVIAFHLLTPGHGFSCPLGWPHSESLLPPEQPLPFAS